MRSPDGRDQFGRSSVSAPRFLETGEHLCHDTEDYLGLDIKDDAFAMVLSAQLPNLVSANLGPTVSEFLNQHGLSLMDFDGFLFHAGGRKILESAEEILGAEREQMVQAWSGIRDYGKMSSATILFVLERALAAGVQGRHLMAAFGFGFSARFAVIHL